MPIETGPAVEVAVVQFSPDGDPAANLERIRLRLGEAVEAGAQLVVFPEYSHYFTPRMDAGWSAAAEPLDGRFATALVGMAQDAGATVVAGMLEAVGDGSRFRNTLIATGGGAVLATYSKVHLYDAFGQRESDFVAPGEIGEPQTFGVGGLTVGMQTCYDLRFPEVTRRLVDHGAELVLVPSEWVPGPLKLQHWRTLLAARAIENTVFVAAADHARPGGIGASVVLDPAGVELAVLGEDEGIASARVTRGRIDEVRAVNPALAMRRFTVVPKS